MPKITPCLWFNNKAEEAVKIYSKIFRNFKINETTYYGEGSPFEKGTVLTISFSINGQNLLALNGGPEYSFTPAISFIVNCANQEEIDDYWDKLSDGGVNQQCGWLQDKFGVSWQIVPENLNELISDSDTGKSQRVFGALMQMVKIDIDTLQKAHDGK